MNSRRQRTEVTEKNKVAAFASRSETRIASIRPLALAPTVNLGDEILTAKELEALLKIDVKTIYGYVQRGLIPYVRIQSNVRFLRQEILLWIERQAYRPRPAKRTPQADSGYQLASARLEARF